MLKRSVGTLPEIVSRIVDKGVLSNTPSLKRLQWNQEKQREEIFVHRLRDDELLSVYALVHLCKDSEGNDITKSDVKNIVRGKLRYVISKGFPLYEHFRDSDHRLTKAVAAAFEKPEVKRFFTEKCLGWLSDCSNAGVLESSSPNYAPPTTK